MSGAIPSDSCIVADIERRRNWAWSAGEHELAERLERQLVTIADNAAYRLREQRQAEARRDAEWNA